MHDSKEADACLPPNGLFVGLLVGSVGVTSRSLLPRLLLVVLLSALAIPTFIGLVSGWENNPDYAHGWFLVPAIGWLLWQAQPWIHASKPESLLGSLMMAAGGLLHLGTLVIPLPLVDFVAWVLLLRGVALCLWGRSGARQF